MDPLYVIAVGSAIGGGIVALSGGIYLIRESYKEYKKK